MIPNSRFRGGFTVVELLIIISVSALLMSMVIFYSRGGEKQIILLREQAKLVSTILRSKSLAIQTFAQPGRACGYGVHFIQNGPGGAGYILFNDLADNCSTSDRRYSGEAEDSEKFLLDGLLKFIQPVPEDILFIPPDPQVVLIPDQLEAIITIASLDEQLSAKIKITNAGQVTIQ